MAVIEHPHVTEKAMNDMDFDNKLQFIVDTEAAKPEIESEIEERFDTQVTNVNTMITMRGQKKAIVTFGEEDDAQDIASRIGVF
ncbi:50S ribosomal protein L23 [Halobacteriales archaeon QS_3_64_16]|nr:MAG: 50S ribosomal protein L23 [Halobacteriales archaeon QS_3_64_16]